MSHETLEMRSAGPEDALPIGRLAHSCFSTYRTFMGPDWDPPTVEWSTADAERRLGGMAVRSRLVLAPERGGAAAAFSAWMPAHTPTEPREPIAGLAHLWMLFVEPSRWGSGLAAELLEWAEGGMAQAQYTAARLWTPTGQARARAFYERNGWRPTGREQYSTELGLPVLEYRADLL